VLAEQRRGDRCPRPDLLEDCLSYPPTSRKSETGGTRRRVWQARYFDFNVRTTKKRVEKLRYLHRNPVKRGLVEAPEQWPWSSFRVYAYQEMGAVRGERVGHAGTEFPKEGGLSPVMHRTRPRLERARCGAPREESEAGAPGSRPSFGR